MYHTELDLLILSLPREVFFKLLLLLSYNRGKRKNRNPQVESFIGQSNYSHLNLKYVTKIQNETLRFVINQPKTITKRKADYSRCLCFWEPLRYILWIQKAHWPPIPHSCTNILGVWRYVLFFCKNGTTLSILV